MLREVHCRGMVIFCDNLFVVNFGEQIRTHVCMDIKIRVLFAMAGKVPLVLECASKYFIFLFSSEIIW